MQKIIIVFIILFLLTLNAGYCQQQEDKWALLVGVNKYDKVSPLAYAVADVTAFRDVLVNMCGFRNDHVYLMTDADTKENKPTDTNILFRLDTLTEKIRPQDTFVFYFSGHGVSINDDSQDGTFQQYLLPINADIRTPLTREQSAIPLPHIQKVMKKIKAKRVLFIIDACSNDPDRAKGSKDNILAEEFSRGMKSVAQEVLKERSRSLGGAPVIATLYACDVGERAYEWPDKGHGVFSYYLLEGIKNHPVDNLAIDDLTNYVKSKVREWIGENLPRSKTQTPRLETIGNGKFIFALQKADIKARKIVTLSSTSMTKDANKVENKPGVPKPPPIEDMAYIKEGWFAMGSNDGNNDEKPAREVYLDAFYIGKYEVTVGQYKKFVQATEHEPLPDWVIKYSPTDNHPVAGVSWEDANAYCEWVGGRLPTEAESEKAARGGLEGRQYPWGNIVPDSDTGALNRNGSELTLPVKSFPANGCGICGMAENVWEWCSDWYNKDYYRIADSINPKGPGSGEYRILRGGAWTRSDEPVRCADRSYGKPSNVYYRVGFRVAASP